jgi:hypothetical protein
LLVFSRQESVGYLNAHAFEFGLEGLHLEQVEMESVERNWGRP